MELDGYPQKQLNGYPNRQRGWRDSLFKETLNKSRWSSKCPLGEETAHVNKANGAALQNCGQTLSLTAKAPELKGNSDQLPGRKGSSVSAICGGLYKYAAFPFSFHQIVPTKLVIPQHRQNLLGLVHHRALRPQRFQKCPATESPRHQHTGHLSVARGLEVHL